MSLRSPKVTFMFKHPFLLDIFDVQNVMLLKISKNDNIIGGITELFRPGFSKT